MPFFVANYLDFFTYKYLLPFCIELPYVLIFLDKSLTLSLLVLFVIRLY